MHADLSVLQNKIDYTFNDLSLLKTALSHSSYINEVHETQGSNERLEFLGDSVLGMIMAEHLFLKNKNAPEGELTKIRATMVCEKSLAQFAREIDLGSYLFLGRGEESGNGRSRPSLLADAFEALIAAIFLDGGIENAKKFILKFAENNDINNKTSKDSKTFLQEVIQQNPEEFVEYILVNESGPDHNKTFEVEVHLNNNVIGRGKGHSKKMAEQEAAREALELMGL